MSDSGQRQMVAEDCSVDEDPNEPARLDGVA
jgi:hypothetical protein